MLRVQLLNKQRAEDDYASSRVSIDKRQVPWLLTPEERKALPIGVLRKLRQLEREEESARKQLPGFISKLVKGYELRMWWFEVSLVSNQRFVAPRAHLSERELICHRSLNAFGSSPWLACPSSSSHPAPIRNSSMA